MLQWICQLPERRQLTGALRAAPVHMQTEKAEVCMLSIWLQSGALGLLIMLIYLKAFPASSLPDSEE